ncbi:MAG: glycosyltransferase [bacterium]|nr:glycosyltransferase [bacterium]
MIVIPAFNEQMTIGQVVAVAKSCSLVNEVVVVSDGSTDDTVAEATKAGARVLAMKENVGKGGAMKIGIDNTDSDVVLFLDADLIGLTKQQVSLLLAPVLAGEVSVSIGIFAHGRIMTDFAQMITPFLSGQRAITRKLLNEIPDFSDSGWGVEVALSRYIEENNILTAEVILDNVTQVTKEEKIGLYKGLLSRLQMYFVILKKIYTMKIGDKNSSS